MRFECSLAYTGEEAVDAVTVDEDKEAKFFFFVSSVTNLTKRYVF